MNYLTSFRPLCLTAHGRRAIAEHNLPRFLDGSCRREPDLQNPNPSITGLCRGGKFAPRLKVGDGVALITVRGRYGSERSPSWRLVAILRVMERFEDHLTAARWYRGQGLPLPSNCMVEGNDPQPLDRTSGPSGFDGCSKGEALSRWDAFYRERAARHPTFLVCEPVMVELREPAKITEEDWRRWNRGRVPGTQTPPSVEGQLWEALIGLSAREAAWPWNAA